LTPDLDQEGAPPAAPSSILAASEIARLEAENGLRQYDFMLDVIQAHLQPDRPFALRPPLFRDLQRIAVAGIEQRPGEWRTSPVRISRSAHQPPAQHLVPHFMVEMCDYVNENWHERTAFDLAAFVMWRTNWIHPFAEGNRRTSRAASYIVLCAHVRNLLPGSPAIPQQIQENRARYFEALEQADERERQGEIDVSTMENLLRHALARQLLSVIDLAGGSKTD